MLGHRLWTHFRDGYDVRVTLRRGFSDYQHYNLFDERRAFTGVDVRHLDALVQVFASFRPDVVINAVGVIKQRPTATDRVMTLEINALFPHRVATLCQAAGARLIHLSTDCVFSGRKGNYVETDTPDAKDVYGMTKLLGEVVEPRSLTLRTSIIGPELDRKASLIEWFLGSQQTIKGFCRAIYSGFTTTEMARIIEGVIKNHSGLSGLYHVASEPISKYDLLVRLNELLDLNKQINPDTEFFCDRSLRADRFRDETGYCPPTWDSMLKELSSEIRSRR